MINNTNILLIVPRYNLTNKKDYSYLFPVGLAYISAVLKKAGYNVDCLNLNHIINRKVKSILIKTLDSKKYNFVCTGGYTQSYSILTLILNIVKKHPSTTRTILGGQIISTEPKLMFKLLKPDFAIIGEGEETILDLLETIQTNKDINKVNGIVYIDKNKKIIQTPQREPIKDLDSFPFPDLEGIGFREFLDNLHSPQHFSMNLLDYPRIYPIVCSRSCPFNCTFCYHDTYYRQRSIKDVIQEIRTKVKDYKINHIIPYDECLAVDKERLYEFCKEIKKLRSELPWDLTWMAQLIVRGVDKELLEVLKDSGCTSVAYGFESFSPIVLKSMKKPITPEEINNAFRLTLEVGLAISANFIFGDVAETKETSKETLDYWKENCKGQFGLSFIQPYPGTEIYKHCLTKGIIKDKVDFLKNKMWAAGTGGLWLNMTDKMTDKEINDLRTEALDSVSKYFKFVVPYDTKRTGDKIYTVNIQCPFCEKSIEYKNLLIENKFSYGFHMTCKECRMRFFIVSRLQKIAYRYYPTTRTIRTFQRNLKTYFKNWGKNKWKK